MSRGCNSVLQLKALENALLVQLLRPQHLKIKDDKITSTKFYKDKKKEKFYFFYMRNAKNKNLLKFQFFLHIFQNYFVFIFNPKHF